MLEVTPIFTCTLFGKLNDSDLAAARVSLVGYLHACDVFGMNSDGSR